MSKHFTLLPRFLLFVILPKTIATLMNCNYVEGKRKDRTTRNSKLHQLKEPPREIVGSHKERQIS